MGNILYYFGLHSLDDKIQKIRKDKAKINSIIKDLPKI